MSLIIQDQIHFLLLFVSEDTTRDQREALLDTVTKHQLNALSEVSLNILKASVELSPRQKLCLKKHASKLRTLSAKKSTLSQRRNTLTVPFVLALLNPIKDFLTHQLSLKYGDH